MKKRLEVRKLLYLLPGVLCGITLGRQFSYIGNNLLARLSIFLIVGAIAFSITTFLLYRAVWPNLASYTWKVQVIWVGLSLVTGFFFVHEIPITVYPKLNTIHIVATKDKNPASESNEVWLLKINADSRASSTGLAKICRGGWQTIEDALVFSGSEPQEITCHIISENGIYVSLLNHSWSGKVRLSLENQVRVDDLYSATGGTTEEYFQITLSRTERLIWFLLYMGEGIFIGIIITALTLVLASRSLFHMKDPLPKSSLPWYLYASVIGFCWFFYLLAFWPGFITPDSVEQLRQITSGQLTDWHPAFHTMALWLLTRFWFSPAPVVILQIVILSVILGLGLSTIERIGIPSWIAWLIALFFIFSPAYGTLLMTIWKDILYSITVLALTLILIKLVVVDNHWIEKPSSWLALGITAAFVALFRHNGFLVSLGTLLGLVVSYRKYWRSLIKGLILFLFIYYGVRGPVYKLANVQTSVQDMGQNLGISSVAFSLVVAHRQNGTQLLPSEQNVIDDILSKKGATQVKALALHSQDILRIALKVSLRNPGFTLRYLINQSSFIFQIFQPPRVRLEYAPMGIFENPYGIEPSSKLPILETFIRKITAISEKPEVDWLIWRNAFWMYACAFAAITAGIRLKDWKILLIVLPLLLNAIPLAFVSGGQLSRYIFPTLLIGPLLGIGLLFPERVQSVDILTSKLLKSDLGKNHV